MTPHESQLHAMKTRIADPVRDQRFRTRHDPLKSFAELGCSSHYRTYMGELEEEVEEAKRWEWLFRYIGDSPVNYRPMGEVAI